MLTRRTFLALPIVAAACKRDASVIDISGATMGTTYNVVAIDHNRALTNAELKAAIQEALAEVNTQMSNWDPHSEISRFNAANSLEPVRVSPALYSVAQAAQKVHQISDGQFDVTLGPLIELWGFGANGTGKATPSDSQITVALAQTGQNDLIVAEGGSLRKTRAEAELFLSAIGKGYGVDRVARALDRLGVEDYMVEIGGDLYTKGRNADGLAWSIGVESPDLRSTTLQKVVSLSNMGMATSGDYRNYFEVDGQRYSHILDAKTGRPVTHKTASATVLTENAMLADAWATAMLVLGSERGMEIADQQDLAVLFVDRDTAGETFIAKPSAAFSALQA